jgi:membrane-associated phospholipid phosphatase
MPARHLTNAVCLSLTVLAAVPPAIAGHGILRIDHRLSLDDDGPWTARHSREVLGAVGLAAGATALWEGSDTRLGKTAWQATDAALIGAVSSEGLKRIFTRERPTHTDDPDRWFKGHSNASFPSGETTLMAALVTPFVLEYRNDYPLVYALELFPVFTAVSRVRVNAHWQSDVIAGFALGSAAGYVAHSLPEPFVVTVLPRSVTVGVRTRF